MYPINDDLKEFIESGVATIVGTGDARGKPQLTYGWAPRVVDSNGVLEVFLDKDRADRALADLRENGRIAMTLAHPVSYRSVQFKGRFREADEPADGDADYVQRRRADFVTSTSLIGDPPSIIESLWLDETVRVSFEVDRAFDQTPGPEAGREL
jgi:hypothetical protein